MKRHDNRKKKLIISNENLSDELRELFKEAYPEGHKDYMQKIVKPDGTPIFVVPLETEDTSYMVKFEVRIDSHLAEEELDKELFADDDIKDETSKFEPLTDDPSEKHDPDHKEFNLKHGAYEDAFDLPDDEEEDEYEEKDDYIDEDEDEDEESDDEYLTDYDDGPNDADIMDIENFMKESNIGADDKAEKATGKSKAKKEPKTKKETKAKKEPKVAKTTKKETKSTKIKAK